MTRAARSAGAVPDQSRGPGYIGAIASISALDVPALFEGAKFYSPAVGDANKSSLTSWLTGLLERNGPVSLRRAEALDPETTCAAVCVLGSGSALADLPPSGNEFALAIRQIEQLTGSTFGAIYPLAAATVSAIVPVVAASQLGVPLIDADGMGRTFALIHHTAMHLAGVPVTPLVAHGPTGESVLVQTRDGPRADRLLRGSVDALGGWAAVAAYPTTAGVLRRAALPGTVSRLINVGRVLLQYAESDQLLVRLAAVVGARRIGRGRIVELEHLSRPTDWTIPAHPSSLVIEEIGGLRRQLRIELRSEIVAVFADGELVAAAPDLLCLFDAARGVLATLDSLEPGDLVDVLATPADAIWYSPEGMAMVGLAANGIPLPHPLRR